MRSQRDGVTATSSSNAGAQTAAMSADGAFHFEFDEALELDAVFHGEFADEVVDLSLIHIYTVMDDHGLLQAYLEHRSEPAFAELVERHLSFVHGTALRLVHDPHAAQDVAQTVFILLARKPWVVQGGTALPGWLYRTTQRAAYNALRSESRRRRRETEAMKLAEQNQEPARSGDPIEPALDEALHRCV